MLRSAHTLAHHFCCSSTMYLRANSLFIFHQDDILKELASFEEEEAMSIGDAMPDAPVSGDAVSAGGELPEVPTGEIGTAESREEEKGEVLLAAVAE